MNGSFLFSQPTIGPVVVRHLPPIDYKMLRLAVPTILRRKDVYPSMYEFVLEAYKVHVKRYARKDEHLITMLDHYVLSGGFLMAVLMGTPVSPIQDMDFYNVMGVLNTRLPERFQRNNDGIDPDDEPDLWEYYSSMCGIRCIDRYKGNGRPLQIISAAPHVFNQFDLDICRVGLGLGRLRITNPSGLHQKMTIAYPWKLFKPKYDMFATRGDVRIRKSRMRKYVRRGFDICFELWNANKQYQWPMIPNHIPQLAAQLGILKLSTWKCRGHHFYSLSNLCGECDECETFAALFRGLIEDFWKQEWVKDADYIENGLYRLKATYINAKDDQ